MAQRGRPRKSPVEAVPSEPSGGMALQDYPRHERENADRVQGRALFELGRRYGLPMSSMERMTVDKLRQQIKLAQTNAMQVEPA